MSSDASHPTTTVPGYVPGRLLLMTLMIGAALVWVFGPFWGAVVLLVVLACLVPMFTPYVEPFTVRLVLDALVTKEIRCLRKGLNVIAPGEVLGAIIDIKKDIKGVMKDETYPTKLGKVKAKYIYSFAPDDSSDEALRIYASYEPDAIEQAGRALFSTTLSDYFRDKETDEDILHKSEINRKLFEDSALLKKFAKEHGVQYPEVTLEDVDFDAQVQKYRDAVAGAKSFGDGVKMLKKKGMQQETAEKYMRLLTDVMNVHEHIFTVDAPDLKNLTHISVMGGLGTTEKKGGKK